LSKFDDRLREFVRVRELVREAETREIAGEGIMQILRELRCDVPACKGMAD